MRLVLALTVVAVGLVLAVYLTPIGGTGDDGLWVGGLMLLGALVVLLVGIGYGPVVEAIRAVLERRAPATSPADADA